MLQSATNSIVCSSNARILIDGALCALLSASHVLVIGPPGTAKSMLADELCRRIEGANYFQWLLTKFSTPEEIFGAVSLKASSRTTTGG